MPKKGKDRVTVWPATLIAPLRDHLSKLFDRFERQRKLREPGAALREAPARSNACGAILDSSPRHCVSGGNSRFAAPPAIP
jgi:hypothetical protein